MEVTPNIQNTRYRPQEPNRPYPTLSHMNRRGTSFPDITNMHCNVEKEIFDNGLKRRASRMFQDRPLRPNCFHLPDSHASINRTYSSIDPSSSGLSPDCTEIGFESS